MSHIGVWGVVGLVVIVVALVAWIFGVMRAQRDPMQTKEDPGKLKRGPVSGGAIHGDPGQAILTGETAERDEATDEGEAQREKSRENGPLDL